MTTKPSETHQAHVCSFILEAGPDNSDPGNATTLSKVLVLCGEMVNPSLLILLTKAQNTFSVSSYNM